MHIPALDILELYLLMKTFPYSSYLNFDIQLLAYTRRAKDDEYSQAAEELTMHYHNNKQEHITVSYLVEYWEILEE